MLRHSRPSFCVCTCLIISSIFNRHNKHTLSILVSHFFEILFMLYFFKRIYGFVNLLSFTIKIVIVFYIKLFPPSSCVSRYLHCFKECQRNSKRSKNSFELIELASLLLTFQACRKLHRHCAARGTDNRRGPVEHRSSYKESPLQRRSSSRLRRKYSHI